MKKITIFYIFFMLFFLGCSSTDTTNSMTPLSESEGAALSLAADSIVFDPGARN